MTVVTQSGVSSARRPRTSYSPVAQPAPVADEGIIPTALVSRACRHERLPVDRSWQAVRALAQI
jgi:hypothetical protein